MSGVNDSLISRPQVKTCIYMKKTSNQPLCVFSILLFSSSHVLILLFNASLIIPSVFVLSVVSNH